jgi:hypothetical protein
VDYEAFVIEIRVERDGSLGVGVLRSPAGQGRSRLVQPFAAAELVQLGVDVTRINARHLRPAEADVKPLSPQEVGDRLFRAVFNGAIRNRFERSMGLVEAAGKGLCVQIESDLREPELAWLHELPWELLYDAETEEFLCLTDKVQVARYIDAPRPERPRPAELISILALVSDVNGRGYPKLDLDQELKNLDQAARQEGVRLVVLRDAHRGALAAALAKEPFQVLHFLGHGWFNTASCEGGLVFQTTDHLADLITGRALATELKNFRDLEMVFLNSCSTARTSSRREQSPFLGAATALVLAGVPCVIAMRAPVSDSAAIAFSSAFYQALSAGRSVEMAMYSGRMAVERLNHYAEWAAPVIFLRRSSAVVAGRRWRRLSTLVWPAIGLLSLVVVFLVFPGPALSPPTRERWRIAIPDLGSEQRSTEVGASLSELPQLLRQKFAALAPQVEIVCVDCTGLSHELQARLGADYLLRIIPRSDVGIVSAEIYDRQGRLRKTLKADLKNDSFEALRELADGLFAELSSDGLQLDRQEKKHFDNTPTRSAEALKLNNEAVLAIRKATGAASELGDPATKQLEIARKSLDKALNLEPSFAAAIANRAWLDELAGNNASALTGYCRASSLVPYFAPFSYQLGRFRLYGGVGLEAGSLPRAIKNLETATRLDPTYWRAFNELGECFPARKPG